MAAWPQSPFLPPPAYQDAGVGRLCACSRLQIGARLLPTADTRVDAAQLLGRSALPQRRDSHKSLAC